MRPRSPAAALGLREELLPGLSSAADSSALLLATVELPADTDPLALWESFPGEPGVYWDTDTETISGAGICLAAEAVDQHREHLTRLASAVRLPASDFATDQPPTPRLLGAVPFVQGWIDEGWARLGPAGFALPRWTLFRRAGRSTLQLAIEGPICDADLERVASELTRLEASLSSPAADRPWGRFSAATIPPGQDELTWGRAVEAALEEIRASHFQKVVLSRCVTHEFSRPVSAVTVLRQLSASAAGRYRFGLRHGDTAFVGASPECLFDKRGTAVELEALAGTYDLGGDDSEAGLIRATEHLFASGKDLEEQSLVVRGILDALTPLSDSVTAAEWPTVREARGLAHLSTQLVARLRPGVSPFELIDALHPTPAVGGLPRPEALAFIRATETSPRGLFAGPVGWISPDGDACLAVAIRSALLLGNRACVYAGAGIVAASDPTAEWEETTAKLRWLHELCAETQE
ncbi:MAG: isochorismate synthase [Gemmatimonadota bacterium]|nr:isochorismate synthase [Gemmatimonadota bacterium]